MMRLVRWEMEKLLSDNEIDEDCEVHKLMSDDELDKVCKVGESVLQRK